MRKLAADQAVILKGVGGQYTLHRYEPFFNGLAVPRGIFRKRQTVPLPGDEVIYSSSGDPDIPYVIDEILPRRNQLVRPPMANLDKLLITVAITLPEPDYFLIDRLTAYATIHRISPLLLLTKLDQDDCSDQVIRQLKDNYRPAGFKILTFGFHEDDDLKQLRAEIEGEIVAFAGQSGVGKSTLINRLFGREMMDIGALSEKGKRGRQTTRHIELFPDGAGYITDTPGFQTIRAEDLELRGEQLSYGYPEINRVAGDCRFNNCTHIHEPGCAVVPERTIHPDRLDRYRRLRLELDQIERGLTQRGR